MKASTGSASARWKFRRHKARVDAEKRLETAENACGEVLKLEVLKLEVLKLEVLKLKPEVNDLGQANASAKAEIARLTSILKTLRRGRFGKKSEKLGSDEDEQQSFAFEEVETGLEAIGARLAAKASPRFSRRSCRTRRPTC